MPPLSHASVGLLAVLALSLSACDMPRDPEDTLERVTGGELRVGIIDNWPWGRFEDGSVSGVDALLLTRFAESLGARITWRTASSDDLLEALAERELDVVAGGITDRTPWGGKVGLTRPYFVSRLAIGVPPGSVPPESADDVEVAVGFGEAAAAHVEKAGARPIRVVEPRTLGKPVAAPDWRLRGWEWAIAPVELPATRHVMAVAPGENAFLVHLERFLDQAAPEVARLLEASAR